MTFKVLITDHPGVTLAVERSVFEPAGIELVVAESTDPEELATLAGDVDAIATCFAEVTADILDRAPKCRTVARFGVGLDNIDVSRATELGMIVTNVPVYCVDEVADHTLMLVLALARRLVPFAIDSAAGGWNRSLEPTPIRLRGKTFGAVGLGSIGSALVPRMQSLGMNVVGLGRRSTLPAGVTPMDSLGDLLEVADVVSLHLPLDASTRHIIGGRELAAMKATALLINTSRGGLVDTEALTAALRAGGIAGAALDVTEPEPLPGSHPLRSLSNVVLTPHYAFSSDGSMADLSRTAAQHVVEVVHGRLPDDVVNPSVLSSPALRAAELAS